jgi:hypothetical protein
MDMGKLRAWWWHRQGLDGSLAGASPAEVLERTGWARSVGGSNPYLSLFARAGTARTEADRAMAALDIYELPAARGCTYVVPSVHFGLALQVGRHAPEADLKVLDRLGVARKEIDRLCTDVLAVLDRTDALDPAQLKDALGDSVRSLGEDGRKKGQSTTLPAALGLLQAAGEIRRVPANGRLDQQRYAYTRWSPPSTGLDDAAARAELARLYFEWIGPASVAHFRWFTAFSVAQAKAALGTLDLASVGEGLLAPTELAKAYAAYVPPAKPRYNLLASIDALVLLRRDHPALLDETGLASMVEGDKSSLGGVADLPDHAIVDRGRIVGLWQYDPDAGTVVAWVFGAKADKAMAAAIEQTASYVREQLGDARSFSLDSPRARAPRIAALAASRVAS